MRFPALTLLHLFQHWETMYECRLCCCGDLGEYLRADCKSWTFVAENRGRRTLRRLGLCQSEVGPSYWKPGIKIHDILRKKKH